MVRNLTAALAASKRNHAEDLLSSAAQDEYMVKLLESIINKSEETNKSEGQKPLEKEEELPGGTNIYISANNVALGNNINNKNEQDDENRSRGSKKAGTRSANKRKNAN